MRAVVYAPDQPSNVRLADVYEPVAGPSEVVVDVRAIALNFGELR